MLESHAWAAAKRRTRRPAAVIHIAPLVRCVVGKAKEPVTEQDWANWKREQRGLPPLPPKLTEAQRKAKDAARNRVARATSVQRRVAKRTYLAPVVDIKTAEPQQNQPSPKTQMKAPATSPDRPKTKRRSMSQEMMMPTEGGPTELAVIAQCEDNPRAAERPATVAQARTLARILDTPEMFPTHATASNSLQKLLASLDAPNRGRKSKGRLHSVIRMTAKTRVVNE
jgi:hypothetical protein